MGVFSWITQDTNKSIAVAGNPGGRSHFAVTMTDNKGNKWREYAYDGYGIFGGMDYYVLVAMMNPHIIEEIRSEGLYSKLTNDMRLEKGNELPLRDIGIEIAFGDYADEAKFPNLTEDHNHGWVDNKPEDCEYQGYFYE